MSIGIIWSVSRVTVLARNDRCHLWSVNYLMICLICCNSRYLDHLDRQKLESMRRAATSKDVKFQRTAYQNMAILSLNGIPPSHSISCSCIPSIVGPFVELNRARIVEWKIIDSAIPLLQSIRSYQSHSMIASYKVTITCCFLQIIRQIPRFVSLLCKHCRI
jgi:hypothetical protein